MSDALDPKIFNSKVRAEARKFKLDATTNASSEVANGTGALVASIKQSTGSRDGQIDRVGLKFARHGIYFEKGAGRGKGGTKGSRWQNAAGQTKTTNANSLGKMNTGSRKAKLWLNPALETAKDNIQEVVVDFYQDAIVKSIQI